MRSLIGVLGAIAALAIGAPAAHADADIDFESPAASCDAAAGSQFAGVNFVYAAPEDVGPYFSTIHALNVGAGAHSGSQVVGAAGCGEEFPHAQTVMQLSQTRAAVSLWVRSPVEDSLSVAVQLRAYDAAGVRIDANGAAYTTLVGTTGPWTQLTAATNDATNRIATVAIIGSDPQNDQGRSVYIDDVHLTDGLVAGGADFTLGPSSTAVVNQGATTSVFVPINRLNDSTGALTTSTRDVPALMVARSLQTGTSIAVDVTANLDAAPGAGRFTLAATPQTPSSGPAERTTAVPIFVRETLPTITISDPAPDTLLDRVPFDPVARGTLTDPRGTARVCVVTSHTADPVAVPASCDGRPDGAGGWFHGIDDLQPGANYITAFVRDGTGHVGRATRLLRIADESTGVDLRITGMQLSQDVQRYRSLLIPPAGTGEARYSGVQLVRGKPLSVRVFANTNRAARSDGTTPGVSAHLRVFTGGRELVISPLLPRPIGRDLAVSSNPYATFAETLDHDQGYRFELPASVTRLGPLTIQATINDTNRIVECPACGANSTVRTTVSFRAMRTREIYPLAFFDTFTGTRRQLSGTVATIFSQLRQVYPFPVTVHPFVATVDVTADLREAQRTIDRDPTARAENWVTHYPGDFERDHNPNGPAIGVAAPGTYPGGMETSAFFCCLPPRIDPFAVVLENRPLTSVAHEFGHTEGLAHADHTCGGNDDGQVSDNDWPDRQGTLSGVGVDLALDRVLPGVDAAGTPMSYDFMSYCAGEGNGWISTRNWDILADHEGLRAARSARVRQLPPSGPAGPGLAVSAVLPLSGGAGAITDVQPIDGGAQGSDPAGDAQLVVTGADGARRSATSVRTVAVHSDVPGATPQLQVTGVVPAGSDPSAVSVVRNGAVAASRTASAHAPTVKLLAPRRSARVRGALLVRWKGADADGDTLSYAIDEAAGPSAPFKVIGAGFTGRSATIPRSALTPSARARIRVRALDGFRQGVAVVSGVRIDAGPPLVTILDPARTLTVPADGLVALEGQAFDARGRALRGKALTWRLDGRTLATGTTAAATDLAPGRHTVTLTATAGGRRSTATRTVRATPVKPRLLVASGPAKLAKTARTVKLKLASSVASSARISGAAKAVTVKLRRRTQAVTLRIKPGRTSLTLKIALRGGGKTATETVVIG